MENDNLNKLWEMQANDSSKFTSNDIIIKAKRTTLRTIYQSYCNVTNSNYINYLYFLLCTQSMEYFWFRFNSYDYKSYIENYNGIQFIISLKKTTYFNDSKILPRLSEKVLQSQTHDKLCYYSNLYCGLHIGFLFYYLTLRGAFQKHSIITF